MDISRFNCHFPQAEGLDHQRFNLWAPDSVEAAPSRLPIRHTPDHGRLGWKRVGEIMAMRRTKSGKRFIFAAACMTE
jgi:hypothetical protein